MGVTLRSMIIAALLIIGAALLYSLSSIKGRLSEDELSSRFPTFEATNIEGKLYNNQGKLSHSVFSTQLSYYKSKDQLDMQNIFGMVYDTSTKKENSNNEEQNWQITADQAKVVIHKSADLYGNVVFVPTNASSALKKVTTPKLHYDLQTNIINSPSDIKIEGDSFTNQGSNYEVDLNQKTFVIKDQPHATYYP